MTIPLAGLAPMATIFLLVFARCGTLFLLLPGISSQMLPARIRLAIALGTVLVITPSVMDSYAPHSHPGIAMLPILFGELVIGGFLGLLTRLILVSAQVAGATAAFQMGFGFAQVIDPARSEAGLILESFFTQFAVLLFFLLDLHHVVITGLVRSVEILPPGHLPEAGSMAAVGLQVFSDAFLIGVRLALPFIVLSLVFQSALAVLSRLMPQLGVFFIAVPLGILLGLTFLVLLVPIMFETVADFAKQTVQLVFL